MYDTLLNFNIIVADQKFSNPKKSVRRFIQSLVESNIIMNPEDLNKVLFVDLDRYIKLLKKRRLNVATFRRNPFESATYSDLFETLIQYTIRYNLDDEELLALFDYKFGGKATKVSDGLTILYVLTPEELGQFLIDHLYHANKPYSEQQINLLMDIKYHELFFESPVQENNFIQFFIARFYKKKVGRGKFIKSFDKNNLKQFVKFAYAYLLFKVVKFTDEQALTQFLRQTLPESPKLRLPYKMRVRDTLLFDLFSYYTISNKNNDYFKDQLKYNRKALVGIFDRLIKNVPIHSKEARKVLQFIRTPKLYKNYQYRRKPLYYCLTHKDYDSFEQLVITENNWNRYLQHVLAFYPLHEDKILDFIEKHKDKFAYKHLLKLYFYAKYRQDYRYAVFFPKTNIYIRQNKMLRAIDTTKLVELLEDIIREHKVSKEIRKLFKEGYKFHPNVDDIALTYSDRKVIESSIGPLTEGTTLNVNPNKLVYFTAWDVVSSVASRRFRVDLDLSANIYDKNLSLMQQCNWSTIYNNSREALLHTGDFTYCLSHKNKNKIFEALVPNDLSGVKYIAYSLQTYNIDTNFKVNVYLGFSEDIKKPKKGERHENRLVLESTKLFYKTTAFENDYRLLGVLNVPEQKFTIFNISLKSKSRYVVVNSYLDHLFVKSTVDYPAKVGTVRMLFDLLNIEENEELEVTNFRPLFDLIAQQ